MLRHVMEGGPFQQKLSQVKVKSHPPRSPLLILLINYPAICSVHCAKKKNNLLSGWLFEAATEVHFYQNTNYVP